MLRRRFRHFIRSLAKCPFLALSLAAIAGFACAEPPRPPKADHPVLGTWAFAVPGTNCQETYSIRPNGTTLATSGQEVTESVYEIDDKASSKGFFKTTDVIV